MIVTLSVAIGLDYWITHLSNDIVWTEAISEAVSPDGTWRAVVDETTIEGVVATAVTADVHLVSVIDPTKREDILTVDTGGHHEDRPGVTWTAANVMRVTVRNLASLTVWRREYAGVRVELRFDPDDPVARAAWLSKFHHRPDTDLEREW